MGYLILALILIIAVPSYIEVKIRDYYGIQKRTWKNRFVNKTHLIVLVSALFAMVFLVRRTIDQFKGSWIIIIVVAFIVDMFFELRYRKDAKFYMLEVFSFLMIILTYISVSAYLR
ncbi:hypothetical protein SAMN02745751_02653 [Dethiosulfatibacter aminovorans DSM 17477]|uniref:DUF4181 domain-containing protein n=1 Tax=Dethiosulfatibacter aminovorans DSM 17477 TaxID=1121476 RepID=A0A1M6JLY5_9FIRM|nr:hypothetical protein [Dethiosulfatibacter aminovorans]SHJ47716.1 hypothetical protein SAMN02745751_02653 [Dethiosulfatibacter aminovorans DSM 17477]